MSSPTKDREDVRRERLADWVEGVGDALDSDGGVSDCISKLKLYDVAHLLREDSALRDRLNALRPNAHRHHLSIEESYRILAGVFKQVGEAHLAISRSGIRVPGIEILERVNGLITRLTSREPEREEGPPCMGSHETGPCAHPRHNPETGMHDLPLPERESETEAVGEDDWIPGVIGPDDAAMLGEGQAYDVVVTPLHGAGDQPGCPVWLVPRKSGPHAPPRESQPEDELAHEVSAIMRGERIAEEDGVYREDRGGLERAARNLVRPKSQPQPSIEERVTMGPSMARSYGPLAVGRTCPECGAPARPVAEKHADRSPGWIYSPSPVQPSTEEPVAWMYRAKGGDRPWMFTIYEPHGRDGLEAVPLYAHPSTGEDR